MAIYIAFDVRSGRTLGVHHGENASGDARQASLKNPYRREPIAAEHIGELMISKDTPQAGHRYKVDTRNNTLIVAENGVSFGFGSAATY